MWARSLTKVSLVHKFGARQAYAWLTPIVNPTPRSLRPIATQKLSDSSDYFGHGLMHTRLTMAMEELSVKNLKMCGVIQVAEVWIQSCYLESTSWSTVFQSPPAPRLQLHSHTQIQETSNTPRYWVKRTLFCNVFTVQKRWRRKLWYYLSVVS